MKQKLKDYMFPTISDEVQEDIDRGSLNNLHILSVLVFIFELIALIVFLATRQLYNDETWLSIGSVLFCLISCVIVFTYTSSMRKKEELSHVNLIAFKSFFVLIMSAWAIWVSWRHYAQDDQLLTFLTVQLLIVCFIPMRPWHSVILTLIVYGGLYAVLYSVDAASSLNIFNYFVLVLVTMAGMIVRFHSQKKLSENTLLLQTKNKELEYANHHDILTGLRNRLALNEDAAGAIGRLLFAFMIDIDYFKEFNDNFGHSAGDEVLKETAEKLQQLFPDSLCYRYGGDEFVILSMQDEACDKAYTEETYCFDIAAINDQTIHLSIGMMSGTPENYDQVFWLINEADRNLYEVKRKTHSPEFGGHDRRRQ